MNNTSISNGNIIFNDNAYGQIKSLTAYVCKPDRSVLARIRGITQMGVTIKFNDISEISMSVRKYVLNENSFETEQDESYQYLSTFAYVYIPELGNYGYFVINEEPSISAQNTTDEYKSFTLQAYESILQYENLVDFEINQGTATSLEMYDDNLDALGVPKERIQFYNEANPKLSLLDLILSDDYYGWTIGHVDTQLKTLQRSFSVDSQNVYSFLVSDVCSAFECVFVFDTVNKIINAYDINYIGNDTNIYLSLDHFIQSVNIKPQSNDIYTVFNVAGDDDLDISYVNFGSNKIVNVSYPLSFLDDEIQTAYEEYELYKESKRKEYSNFAIDYANQLEKQNSINDRQPVDSVTNNWSSQVYYSLDDLKTDLSVYKSIVLSIEEIYTDASGEIDMDDLNTSTDAAMYHSYKDIIIPDIEAEISKREDSSNSGSSGDGSDDEPPQETLNYSTSTNSVDQDKVWEVYGLNDLETKLKIYQTNAEDLAKSGYDVPWEKSSQLGDKDLWEIQHQAYLDYTNYATELKALIGKKATYLNKFKKAADDDLTSMKNLAKEVDIDTYFAEHYAGKNYAKIIKSLYRESDYQNDNFLITDYDDAISIVAEAEKLYQDAKVRLEQESRPQLSWSISSDNLFGIEDFKPLRDSLQVGDFIVIGYGVTTLPLINSHHYKLRLVELGFDGINITSGSFNLSFSDMVVTKYKSSDLETMLDNYISSKTNSIAVQASNSATTTATSVANSIVRPLISVTNANITTANIGNATMTDLEAVNAKFKSVLADYIKADELEADVAKIDTLSADSAFINALKSTKIFAELATISEAIAKKITVFDLLAGDITTNKSITLVSDSNGSIVLNNSTMSFIDSSGNTRVQIGKDNSGEYSVNIFGKKDSSGNQPLLWGSTGLQAGAIGNGLIVPNMLDDGINEKMDTAISDASTAIKKVDNSISSLITEYYPSTSPTKLVGGKWTTDAPAWEEGIYIWIRTKSTTQGGQESYDASVCITGNTGADGSDAITLSILSSNGVIFKNTQIATTLTARVYMAGVEITDQEQLSKLGTIKWYKNNGTTVVGTGQSLKVTAGEVDNQATYVAQLEK